MNVFSVSIGSDRLKSFDDLKQRQAHFVSVVVGICSHLGCSPISKFVSGPSANLGDEWPGGFLCPCHGSTFDIAGRVFANKPAPDNLEVPRHMYLSDTKLIIGKDKNGEA